MRFFANDLGVDLGTSNVLIYVEGKGVVVREPAVVAVDKNSGKIIQVGMEAKNMLGRTPGNVVAMQPLKGGVISDHVMAVRLLQAVFRKAKSKSVFNPKPRVVICVPSGVTEVEERTVINAAIEAGARRVYLIEEPRAAALGANLDIGGPNGHMVVDIGGGTTDIAVLSMNGVAVSSSIKVAGESFDETIARYVRKARSVVIGKDMAEDLKIRIGSVVERSDDVVLEFIGCSVNSGLPIKVKLHANEIIKEMSKLAEQIAEEVKSVLDMSSPELATDVARNGITLTGGGSQLYGMAEIISQITKVPCTVADDPDSCVALGCGKSLTWINHMSEGPINIARRRAMRKE